MGLLTKNGLLLVLSSLFAPSLLFAQSTDSSMSTSGSTSMNTMTNPQSIQNSWKDNLGLNLDLSRTRSLVDQQDASIQESTDVVLLTSYKLSKANSLSLKLGYSQDLQTPTDSSASDIRLDLAHSIEPLRGYSNYSLSLMQVIPASKDSKDRQDLQYGLGLAAGIMSKPEVILHGRINLAGQLSVVRYFHKYDMAYDETQNNQYSSKQKVSGELDLGKIKLSLNIIHLNTWTYRGVPDQHYEHAEEMAYEISKNFSTYVGHTVAQPDYKNNGASNVALVSDEASRIYIGMTLNN